MNIRHIYQLCEICNYLKIYIGCFDIRVFKSFKIIIHGFILTEGIFFFSKTSRQMVEKKSKQAFSYLINKAKFSIEKIQLSAFMIVLELLAVCYTLLEIRRVKYYSETTVFQVRNDLMNIAKKCYILNLKGNKVPKSLQEKHLLKFCA